MKLNHDCVRLLLLEIESNKKIGEPLTRHNFNDNIRDNKTWNEVKRVVNKTSSMSLNLMGKLAFQYLSQKFNLT
ncbi:TPA: hypothetical protein PEV37_002706 [Staphylococcus aureus]|nr:hypothetical protein [Staphylococcus aureus]